LSSFSLSLPARPPTDVPPLKGPTERRSDSPPDSGPVVARRLKPRLTHAPTN
jgi:hypothetical protein